MNSNDLFLISLAIISGLLIFTKIRLASGVLIFVTFIIGYSLSRNLVYSLCIAFILGNIFVSLNEAFTGKVAVEGFATKPKPKTKKVAKKPVKKLVHPKVSEEFENDTDVVETATDLDNEEYFIDTKGSFIDNYKSLTPNQIKGLNKDTQELITTQKQLIETLNTMGPALKDGKHILDTFKNYFGNDKDLGKMMKNMKL